MKEDTVKHNGHRVVLVAKRTDAYCVTCQTVFPLTKREIKRIVA